MAVLLSLAKCCFDRVHSECDIPHPLSALLSVA